MDRVDEVSINELPARDGVLYQRKDKIWTLWSILV